MKSQRVTIVSRLLCLLFAAMGLVPFLFAGISGKFPGRGVLILVLGVALIVGPYCLMNLSR